MMWLMQTHNWTLEKEYFQDEIELIETFLTSKYAFMPAEDHND